MPIADRLPTPLCNQYCRAQCSSVGSALDALNAAA
jgi:hypothetical protein